MPALKNIRHERFARLYIETGCMAEAYRRVYPNAKPLVTARRNGWHLINRKPKVMRRVNELRAAMLKKSDITFEKILTDYQDAMTRGDAKPSDIIAGATAQAKLVGLLRDRVEAGNVGDFDGAENISDVLQLVADKAGPEAALALAKAFGVNETIEQTQELLNAETPTDSVN